MLETPLLLSLASLSMALVSIAMSVWVLTNREAQQTEEHLIMPRDFIPWSEIDSIDLRHSKSKPRWLTLSLKNKEEKKYDLKFFRNRWVLVSYLDQISGEKGFTFFSDIPVPRQEEPLGALRTVEYKGKVIPDVSFPPRMKLAVYGFMAIFVLGLSYVFLGVGTTALIAIVLMVHEAGHLVASRLVGLKLALSSLLPFAGVGTWTNPFSSSEAEAGVALAGPVACLALYGVTALIDPERGLFHEDAVRGLYWWMALRGLPIVFLINVVDLLPIFPLNGGKILKAVLLKTRRNALVVTVITMVVCAIMGIGQRRLFFFAAFGVGLFCLMANSGMYVNWKRLNGPVPDNDRPPLWKSAVTLLLWIAVVVLYWVALPMLSRFLLHVDYGIH
ncbi:MAG: hypothetical protein HXS52_02735 [Theionarchaea archaeon]|nr:hypothetical protein [Theionarchaea archaeon]